MKINLSAFQYNRVLEINLPVIPVPKVTNCTQPILATASLHHVKDHRNYQC